MIGARSFACTFACALACHAAPCPEARPPNSPPIASPQPALKIEAPPVAPACTLTQAEADARAGAALAMYSSARSEVLPPGFSARDPCESHCGPNGGRTTDGVPCDSWECPFRFGAPGQTLQAAEVTVHVIRCGAQVFTTERLADCFAKPHGCRVIVDRSAAWKLADKRGRFGGSFGPWLRWIPSAGEFQWVVYMDDGSLLRIGAHEQNKIWTGVAPPMPAYTDELGVSGAAGASPLSGNR